MVLTIVIIIFLILPGLVGMFRDIRAGFLTMIGTLVAAALVDLWHKAWAEKLNDWLKDSSPSTWTWVVTTLIFLLVALIVGYGSSTFLKPPLDFERRLLKERLSAALLGLLNGALIVSYLIRYARDTIQDEDVQAMLEMTFLARMLYEWLPWFVLVIVFVVLLNIVWRVIRLAMRASQQSRKRQQAGDATSVAGAKSQGEQFQAISNKIDQRIGKKE